MGGIPAKLLKKRFNDKKVEALQDVKWWDWSTDIIRNYKELIFSSNVDNGIIIEKLKEIKK